MKDKIEQIKAKLRAVETELIDLHFDNHSNFSELLKLNQNSIIICNEKLIELKEND